MDRTVLLADDNPAIMRLLRYRILHRVKDVTIEERVDREGALQCVAATPLDMVILNIRDTVAATKQMRACGYGGPIILHTPNDYQLAILRNNGMGATEVFDTDFFINHGGLDTVLSRYLRIGE